MKNKNFKKGSSLILVLIVVMFLFGGYVFVSKQYPNIISSLKPDFIKSPYEKLTSSFKKINEVKTLNAEYKTKVTSNMSLTKTGVTQTMHNNVDGNISGSTDGKTSQIELKIYNDAAPDRSVVVQIISADNGDTYVKNAGSPKWQKFTKEEFKKQNESSPVDASLYGFDIMGTLFSENQALFKSVKKESIEFLGKETSNSTTYSRYRVEISNPDFINALSLDKEVTKKYIDDSKIILNNSIISAIFYIEDSSNYVKKLHIEAKKLTQVPTEDANKLGVRVSHDIILDADLSRFNVPTNITAPISSEVLGVSTKLKKITLPIK